MTTHSGRGGSRKRKEEKIKVSTSTPVASAPMTSSFLPDKLFNTFKIDPHPPSEHVEGFGNDKNNEEEWVCIDQLLQARRSELKGA